MHRILRSSLRVNIIIFIIFFNNNIISSTKTPSILSIDYNYSLYSPYLSTKKNLVKPLQACSALYMALGTHKKEFPQSILVKDSSKQWEDIAKELADSIKRIVAESDDSYELLTVDEGAALIVLYEHGLRELEIEKTIEIDSKKYKISSLFDSPLFYSELTTCPKLLKLLTELRKNYIDYNNATQATLKKPLVVE
tara:strand:- start:10 stop:594 length:585 start_codon:yes stop_codon:yes gene_type:complete